MKKITFLVTALLHKADARWPDESVPVEEVTLLSVTLTACQST